eukprot:363089-Chlamydomonas_euryale.AAC.6
MPEAVLAALRNELYFQELGGCRRDAWQRCLRAYDEHVAFIFSFNIRRGWEDMRAQATSWRAHASNAAALISAGVIFGYDQMIKQAGGNTNSVRPEVHS